MNIYNSKTNIEFSTRTVKRPDGTFSACVLQGEYKLGHIVRQEIAHRVEGIESRGKAQRLADKLCRTLADNHAYLN